jgi:hypothetical protein
VEFSSATARLVDPKNRTTENMIVNLCTNIQLVFFIGESQPH